MKQKRNVFFHNARFVTKWPDAGSHERFQKNNKYIVEGGIKNVIHDVKVSKRNIIMQDMVGKIIGKVLGGGIVRVVRGKAISWTGNRSEEHTSELQSH